MTNNGRKKKKKTKEEQVAGTLLLSVFSLARRFGWLCTHAERNDRRDKRNDSKWRHIDDPFFPTYNFSFLSLVYFALLFFKTYRSCEALTPVINDIEKGRWPANK